MRTFRTTLAAAILGLLTACGSPAEPEWVNPFPGAQAPGEQDDSARELANRRLVLQYYDAVNNAKDFAAASALVRADVKLHEPALADGVDGLAAHIQSLRERFPEARVEVKRVLTSGDEVFLHSHVVRTPGTVGFIGGDAFRLEDGKIVEQWSVLHPIPEKPHPDNPNGPF